MALPDGVYKVLGNMGVEMRRREKRQRFGSLMAEFRSIDLVTQSLGGQVVHGKVTELGMEGIRIISDGRVNPGDWLEMKLNLPISPVAVTVIAEAKHVHGFSAGMRENVVGMKILEIAHQDKERLRAFLSRASQR